METKIKVGLSILLISLSFNASAAVLMKQWTDATNRYCEYSDSKVIRISFGSVCSATN